MSLPANAHSRPAPKVQSLVRRGMVGVALTLAGAIVAQYLAGYFFLWSFHADPRRATPLTILQYTLYYGHHSFHSSPRDLLFGGGPRACDRARCRAPAPEAPAIARRSPIRPKNVRLRGQDSSRRRDSSSAKWVPGI